MTLVTGSRRTVDNFFKQYFDQRVTIFGEPCVAVVMTDLLNVKAGSLFALDVGTGEQLWEYSIDNTPGLRYHDGVLYHHDRGTLTALAPRTGEPQWQLPERFGQPTDYDGDNAASSGDFERTTIFDLVDRAIACRSELPTLSEAVTCWTTRLSSPDAEHRP